jgi:hypothetical protein
MKLPVVYTHRPAGSPADELASKSPVTEVVIGWGELGRPNRRMFTARALVDSGADEIYVDRRLLADANCPEVPGKSAQIATAHGLRTHKVHRAVILYPGLNAEGALEVVATEIDAATKAYQAVFGTKFLELGRLTLDPRGESYFEFHAESTVPVSTP